MKKLVVIIILSIDLLCNTAGAQDSKEIETKKIDAALQLAVSDGALDENEYEALRIQYQVARNLLSMILKENPEVKNNEKFLFVGRNLANRMREAGLIE